MLTPGYYTVQRDTTLKLGPKRVRLRQHDWLVTDGICIGIFDKGVAMDWVPLGGGSGPLTDEADAQVDAVAVPVTFSQLERRLQLLLDLGDGGPIPDMPKAPMGALGSYLRSHRTLLAYTYER